MKLATALIGILIAFAITTSIAQVREPKEFPRGTYVPHGDVLPGLIFLRRPDVRGELKLSASQSKEVLKNIGVVLAPVKTPDEMKRARAALDRLVATLGKKRKDRLYQLYLQAQGTFALSNDKIADKVGLSKVQKKKVLGIRMDGLRKFDVERKKEGKAFKPDPRTTKWIMDSIEKVLTPSQLKKWKGMLGKPYEWNPPIRPF